MYKFFTSQLRYLYLKIVWNIPFYYLSFEEEKNNTSNRGKLSNKVYYN